MKNARKMEICSPLVVAWVDDDGTGLLEVHVEEEAVVKLMHAEYANHVVASVGPVQVLVDPVEGDAIRSAHFILQQQFPRT